MQQEQKTTTTVTITEDTVLLMDTRRRLALAEERQSRAMSMEEWLADQVVIDRCQFILGSLLGESV